MEIIRARTLLVGLVLISLSVKGIGVSAYVYETGQHTASQTIQDTVLVTLTSAALGDIEEGQTLRYTPTNQSDLDNIISVRTSNPKVHLHFDSDLDSVRSQYSTYNIEVKFDAVPRGSTHSPGDTACTLSLASPDDGSIDLDVAGNWTFDFEITTTADSVSVTTETAVTITVTVQSS